MATQALVMEMWKLKKSTQVSLKAFYTLTSLFFSDIGEYCPKLFYFYTSPNVTYGGGWSHDQFTGQVKMLRYVWADEETEYHLQVMKEKNPTTILDSDINEAQDLIRTVVILTKRDFTAITAYALRTIQWKHLHTAIALCRNVRNIIFIP